MSRNGHDATRERVEAELTGPLQALGLDLEAVEITPAGKRRVLRVALDKDDGVTLDDVAEATREVSRVLDDGDVMGQQPYTLEVTSRGVDRPLTLPRHWRRNAGRLVFVTLHDGEAVTGRIISCDESGAVLAVMDDGAKRRAATPVERPVAYAAVARAQVQVEFNRPQEDRPQQDRPQETGPRQDRPGGDAGGGS